MSAIPAAYLVALLLATGVVHKVYGPWRWFSGATHNGYHMTNASWTRRSHGERSVLHPTGNAIRWHHWPRWWRAGIRTGGTLTAYLLAFGMLAAGTLTLAVLAAAAAGGVVAGGCWAYSRARNWRHNRDWVKPFDLALPPEVTVRKLTRDRTEATLALAPGVVADDKFKELVLLTAKAKLKLPSGELVGKWSLHGKKPSALLTLVPPPPGYVSFADVKPYADAAEEHEFVPGLMRPTREHPKGEPLVISVRNDCPHLGLSMSSGDGKSVASRCSACQFAHHGAIVAICDTKMMSHHWAAGLPNVAYARTPAELHELAIWLWKEVQRRNDVALYSADVEGKVHAKVGPRIIGILEEMNTTQQELQTYWKEELDGKGRSPAAIALDKVSNTGRQVDVNLEYIGQRLSAKAISGGSGDARENIGVFFMRNPAKRTWDMLVGDRHSLPSATDVDGRMHVVTAKEVTDVQGAYITGAEAREYAMSGIVAEPRKDMPCVGGLAPVGTPEREAMERAAQNVRDNYTIEGNGSDRGEFPDKPQSVPGIPVPPPPPVTGPEAVAQGILTGFNSWDSAHKALMRDPSAPRPGDGKRGNAPLWDPIELADWNALRRGLRRQPRRLVR